LRRDQFGDAAGDGGRTVWFLENRDAINAKIRRGMGQLDRGEGIPEGRLDAYLANLKNQPE
jgi:hypothetical protein